jgi:hypothetical protein
VPDSPQISTDAAVEAALLAQLAPQLLHFAQRLLPLDRFLQEDAEARRIDRLTEVVVGAFLDRLDCRFAGALRGEQDDGQIGQLILEDAQQLQSAHARHHQIRDDDRRAERGDLQHRLFAVGGFVGLVPPRTDELGEPDTRRRIVLDNEHPLGDSRGCFGHGCHFSSVQQAQARP